MCAEHALLAELTLPAVTIDAGGAVTAANDAVLALMRQGPQQVVGRHVGSLVDEEAALALAEVLRRVLSGDPWTGELLFARGAAAGDGASSHVQVGTVWTPLRDDHAPEVVTGALVVVEYIGELGRADQLASRLSRLARAATELLAATDLEGVGEVVTGHMADAVGATVSSLSLLVDEDTLAAVAIRGALPGAGSRWATYPRSAVTPVGDALRSGQVLLVSGRAEIRRRYPTLELSTEGERSMVCLPLLAAGRPLGVVGLSFPGIREFPDAELEFLGTLADLCAQALDRLQAVEAAVDREAKLAFLAGASERLASSLDYEATLRAVADLAVSTFADWCTIHLLQDDVLRAIATAHLDEERSALAQEVQERYPPDPRQSGIYQVVRSGQSALVPEVTDAMLQTVARDDWHLQALRRLRFRTALQVPLLVRDRAIGVISWVRGEEGRRFTDEDRAFGEDLARRAALAIDNAQLHTEIRDVATRLQRAVLPDAIPRIEGWELAVRYLPAGRTETGGDFYDVIPLADGRIAAFVGDVMGRGVEAASAMAQMRSAVRTLIAVDPDPAAVMRGLDRLFECFELEQLVTVVYTLLDPATDTLLVANAGHPSPVVVPTTGDPHLLPVSGTLILGAGGGDREVLQVPFRAGDRVLLYTDGLVERRDESLDDGEDRLVRASPLLVKGDLGDALVALVDEVRDDRRDDDVAAVALHRME